MSGASLVSEQGTRIVLTSKRECGARRAIVRGLADYVASIGGLADKGRKIAFERTFETWAEAEDFARYPSAIIYSPNLPATHDPQLTPTMPNSKTKTQSGEYISVVSQMTTDVVVEVWANDIEERDFLAMLCEDAFNPVLFMSGFMLDLPFYFGQRAAYELKSQMVEESADSAQARYRKAFFTLTATVPVTRALDLPLARPIPKVEVLDGNVVTSLEVS